MILGAYIGRVPESTTVQRNERFYERFLSVHGVGLPEPRYHQDDS